MNIDNRFVHQERQVKGTIFNTYLEKVRENLGNPGSIQELNKLNPFLDTAGRIADELEDPQKAALVEDMRKDVAAAVFHKYLEEASEKMQSTDSKDLNRARAVLNDAMSLAARWKLPHLVEKARQLKIIIDKKLRPIH